MELAIWTHYVATQLQPDLLEGLPTGSHLVTTTTTSTTTTNGSTPLSEQSDESNLEPPAPSNGNNGNGMSIPVSNLINLIKKKTTYFTGIITDSLDESTRSEDSLEKSITLIVANEETNTNDSDSRSSVKR